MPNRNVEGEYRYAFQGQEKDPETGMEAFELRMWDARIGRWMTPDPYGQYASPYLGMGNTPINGVDPDGGCFDENGNPCPDMDVGSTMTGGAGYEWTMQEDGWAMNDTDFANVGVNLGTIQNTPTMNTPLWDFSSQINQFQNDTRAIIDKGGIPSAYSIQGYLDSYEQAALTNGRSYVTGQDIDDVDGAMGEVMMTIMPIGRVLNLAGKGYTLTRTIGKFHIFEKTIKATHLSGHARSVFQKVYNQQGKLIRVRKMDFKIDGRMYQSKPKFPNFPNSRRLH